MCIVYLIIVTSHTAVLCVPHLCVCMYVCVLQIIHLKRFQFFNGRWVKSQRTVRFPGADLDPLRYTVQNGNEHRHDGCGEVQNGTKTVQTGTGTVQNGTLVTDQQIPPCGEQLPTVDNDLCSSPRANRGEPLQISAEVSPIVADQTRRGSTPNHQGLTQVLHQREGHTYKLFAITVSTVITLIIVTSHSAVLLSSLL